MQKTLQKHYRIKILSAVLLGYSHYSAFVEKAGMLSVDRNGNSFFIVNNVLTAHLDDYFLAAERAVNVDDIA